MTAVKISRDGTLGANGERVLKLMSQAVSELYDKGWGPTTGLPGYYGDELLTASLDDRVVGFITHRSDEKTGTLNLIFGYVDPGYRRFDIYTQLWQELVKYAQEKKYTRIDGTTHVDNHRMRGFYVAAGRKETWITSVYMVPPTT